MNLLLDTHSILWWLDDNPKLSNEARRLIADPTNIVVLSAVVIWEIRIKQAIGKLLISDGFFQVIKRQGFEMMSISIDHAYAVGELPMHHRDPFDRMIIAQAKCENLTVLTHDAIFEKYEIPVLMT